MYKIINDQSSRLRTKENLCHTISFHPKRFINLGCKSNAYKYCFFIKTFKEWNGLPDELIEQETLKSFRSALAD